MKKKVLCLFLGICLCISFAFPLYAIDGPINANDDAELVTPTLEITTIPTGAAAIAHNLTTNQTYYYRINGNILSNNDDEIFAEPGWMPETYSVDGVIGNDNRERVSSDQLQEAPFSAIAYIETIYPNGQRSKGTATMISPNAAVTAAHCLYNSQRGGWPTQITIFPAVNGSIDFLNYPYGSATATEVVISIPYFESGRGAQWDWGVIRLNSNIGNASGFLGFQCIESSLEATPIMISGYPGDLNDYWETRDQFYHNHRIASDNSYQINASNGTVYDCRHLTYKVDTARGQSGSAILYNNNGVYQIIGIHSQGYYPDDGDGNPDNDYVCIRNDGFGFTSQVFHFLLSYKNNS